MSNSVTVINHATVLVRLGPLNVLTDPIYSRTVSYLFPRLQKPGIALDDLPPIDCILVSHSDYDHLNLKTLRHLRRRQASTIIFPTRLGLFGRKAGFQNVIELTWWEEFERDGLKITCVPAKHRSKRSPRDQTNSACCGYVIRADGAAVYFAGDTAYADFFPQIGSRFDIDVALLPIGAYKPEKWFKNLHLHPATALRAFRDLKAKYLIPVHWGTFWISDEPMAEPPQLLLAEAEHLGLRDSVHILKNGESLQF